MQLEFKRFDQELLDNTKTEWERQILEHKDEVYAPQFQQKLDWAEKRLHDDTGTLHVYAVTDVDQGGHAVAIIELNHAMPKSSDAWLKMMSMTVQPCYDISVGKADNSDLARIAGKSISESYGLIFADHPSATLKVIGNNSISIEFLKYIATTLQDIKIKAYTQGQWLVIEKCDPNLLTR
mmetsp:Transcript_15465/g.19958  ORF Transcript_15465/g.19958 Transcript_15465/m.19958 type:complete len:180 (-) Transcript_15465:657-1196(-)